MKRTDRSSSVVSGGGGGSGDVGSGVDSGVGTGTGTGSGGVGGGSFGLGVTYIIFTLFVVAIICFHCWLKKR